MAIRSLGQDLSDRTVIQFELPPDGPLASGSAWLRGDRDGAAKSRSRPYDPGRIVKLDDRPQSFLPGSYPSGVQVYGFWPK